MPTVTYKCPNCDAGLIFDPQSGNFACEYCNAQFTEEELNAPKAQSDTNGSPESSDSGDYAGNSLYRCPSCGAEVITDDTTAATMCVYCHNPVILSGKVDGTYKPDYVVPFTVEKARVQELFKEWCGKKKFIQDEFLKQAKSELLMGVYYPFWVVDCKVSAGLSARGEKVRTWRSGNTEYTETSIYTVIREGDIDFNDIAVTALDKKQARILDGVHPYDMTKAVPFSPAFFSGFLAEKRNIEKENARPKVEQIIQESSKSLLLGTVSGYSSLSVISQKAAAESEKWLYLMLPAWMFTYKYKGEDYYFSMNGESGKIAGRVPVSPKKLSILFAGLTAGIAGILMLMGWLL
jgi:DNA-directed RNA polymerase subunit RPC12/RpoP